MKFGIFMPNGRNGYIMSRASPQYMPTFVHNKAIAVEAEAQGFDMILSMMKYRGFGGETNYWDACLETFTLMAALAAATSRVELFPSVTLPALHPAVVARMVSTIDDISGGRCGLNVVTGWNKAEYEQMGFWRGEDMKRYEFAKEYLSALKSLWENDSTTLHGANFTLDDCQSSPLPKHKIPIVSAGQSPAGMRFVAEFGDRSFVQAGPDRLKQIVTNLKNAGREFGRQVGAYAVFHIIAAKTDAEAAMITENIVKHADTAAITNMIRSAMLDTNPNGISEHQTQGMTRPVKDGNSAFMTIPVVHGSFETVAVQLDSIIAETGIDGLLCSFPDFVAGVRGFGQKIRPRMNNA